MFFCQYNPAFEEKEFREPNKSNEVLLIKEMYFLL